VAVCSRGAADRWLLLRRGRDTAGDTGRDTGRDAGAEVGRRAGMS